MKKHTFGIFQRFFALLLCAALMLPLIPAPSPVSAAAVVSGMNEAQSVVDQVRSLYTGGVKSNSLEMDCGNDLTGGGEKSYMTIVTGTTATHFANFQKRLKSAGYQVKREHTITSNSSTPNSFGDYTSPEGTCRVYTYFLPDYQETRIIVDTQADTVEGYVYVPQSGKVVEPKMVMWGVSVNSPEGPQLDEWRNCCGIIVIRMPDNSLFIHDGGDNEQWSQEACDAFLAFCRELTGTKEGEKMVINTWFLSHAHKDHHRGFTRFINHHYDKFDLKNVMYTIDQERSGVNFDLTGLMGLLSRVYPDARYYKPHTGEHINIAGVSLDILYTLEDRFVPNADNQLIIDKDNKGGTYREGLYKDEATQTYDFNDTSTVIRITFDNGVNSILYADSTRAKSIFTTMYPTSFFKTDIMLVPHHGHNNNADLVKYADAKVYLYIQHKKAAYGPDDDVTTIDMYGTYRETTRQRFITMFPDMNVPAGTEKVDYDIFWSGNEVVTMDINALGEVINGTSTEQYYTTQPAMVFDYTGWGVWDLNDKPYNDQLISLDQQVVEESQAVTTTTIRYNPVASGALKENGRYIIKHKQMQTVMSYNALAQTAGTPNKAASLWPTTESTVDPTRTNIYYENPEKGIYLDHSNRFLAMWILHQEDTATDAALITGSLEPMFGGSAYGEVWLNKGNVTEYDADGNKTAGRNGVYWNGIHGADGNDPATQYRYLDPRYDDEGWVTTSEPTGTDAADPKKRYIIEDLGNGDFLVYWRSVSGATMGFLTCDEHGNWGIQKFTNDTSDNYPSVPKAGSAELDALKLNFYVYKVFTDSKIVQFTGSKTFNVRLGTTQAQLLSIIQDNILLNDTTRRGLRIPCNGTASQVGYCYLKFDKTFDSGTESSYNAQLLFRNDDNTDTLITTLTVNVTDNTCDLQGHTYKIEVTSATCTAAGYTTYTCSYCGESYVTDEVPALGHSYETVTTDPDCVNGGYTTYTCATCGDEYVADAVDSLGHKYRMVITDPTCTTAGYTTYTCDVCGDQYVANEVVALGHKYNAQITLAPGCESAGTKTFTCETCGDVYTEPLAATGHNYEVVVTAPTCTQDGYTTYTCPCGHSYITDVVSAPGHRYETVTVDATCTQDGSATTTCTACGDTQVEVLPATGHNYVKSVTAPTCTEIGFTTEICSNCGDGRVYDEVAALGHDYDAELIAPGCTEKGYTLHTCQNCEDTYTTDEVAALGHQYQAVITTAPGCESAGTKLYTCQNCGDAYAEPLAATGHNYTAVVTAPTCTQDGYTTYTCPCGHQYVADTTKALGHSFSGSTCRVCGVIAEEFITAVVNQTRSLYSGGTKSNALEMDCGNGLTHNGEKSYMTIVTGTTATHFSNYQKSLKNAGYVARSEKTIKSNSTNPNSFGDYISPDGSCRVYTYFLPDYSETRIIVDTHGDIVEGFVYEPQEGVTVEPKMVMFGMSMSEIGYGLSELVSPNQAKKLNCGGMIILRMPDNSLFIHDGGDYRQFDDQTCDDFLAICRELTGVEEGEKMVINTWFMSHAHRDHYQGFYRFINKYYDKFELKNVMYIIDKEREGSNFDITGLTTLLAEVYPDVRYYRPHTGETFNIAGVTLDIIYTLEDRFVPDSSNKLMIDTDNKGGTYRDGMYKNSSTQTYDFNDTSTVIRITFENGVNSILYADATRAKSIYTKIYPTSYLKTDIMMLPHHGHNSHPELVEYADAKVYLYTQHKNAVYGPDNDVSTLDMYGTYRENVRNHFIAMFPDMYVPAGTEKVDYDIFWAGNETVVIDINTLGKVIQGTSKEKYYTSRAANDGEYTGWGMTELSSEPKKATDVLVSTENVVQQSATGTSTNNRYNPVASGGLKENGRYIIKHKQMQTVMSYDAMALSDDRPSQGTSFWPVTQDTVDGTRLDIYFETEKGIYLDHSNRALGIWILHQEDAATDAALATGPLTAMYGGKAYGEVWLNKGTATEWDAEGNKTAGRNGVYWNAVHGNDSNDPVTQYRFLDPRYADELWVTTSEPTGTDTTDAKKRYIIEDLGNGDFLIYWRSVSGATMGFLTCDEWGNWGIKMFTDDTSDFHPAVPKAGSATLESLKLNLYNYINFTSNKTIQFSGAKTYHVVKGTSQAEVVEAIEESILLNDTGRYGLRVPCNGTSSKIGYGYLKFNKTFDPDKAGTYELQVLFRNDDNTDTQITTLTVNVLDNTCDLTGHSYETVTVEASCTADGSVTNTCTACGDIQVEVIPATGHSYNAVVTVPTCTETGYTTHTCACGDSYVTDEVAALGHNYQGVITSAPGCETVGMQTFTCRNCGDIYMESVPATGHSYNAVVTAPTCTETGYTTHTCACGDSYVTDEVAALGHNYQGVITSAPGCETVGMQTFTCRNCRDIYMESVPATGHSFANGICGTCGAEDPDYVVNYYLVGYINGADYGCEDDYQNMGQYKFVDGKLVATFTQDSYVFLKSEGNADWFMTWSYCTDTSAVFYNTKGGAYEKMYVPAHVEITFTLIRNADGTLNLSYVRGACAHEYEVVRTEPTCTEVGSVVSTCRYCGDVQVEEIKAPGHDYKAVVTEPTCTLRGYTTYTCSVCSSGYVADEVAALGHSYRTVTVEATCTADGSTTDTCATCGDVQVQVLPATGHSHRVTQIDPTCTTGGYTSYACHCGDSYLNNWIEPLGHSYVGGICSACGMENPAPVVQPTLTLKAPTLEFKDMITVNAMFEATNLDDVVEMGMITYTEQVTEWSVETANHVIPGTTYDVNTGRYIACSQGIHAKYLGDTVYLACYAKLTDGTYVYTKLASYSPVQYAESKLQGNDVPLKQLVVAMLNYGAAAQVHFGHKPQNLANATLTAEQVALPENYRSDMVSTVASPDASKQGAFVNNKGFAKRYPAISFEGAFCINYFFTPNYAPVDGITLYYWNAADYEAVETLTVENASGSMKLEGEGIAEYRGDITGIAAKALSEATYVAAIYSDGANTWTSGVLGYSIGAYCAGQSTKGGTIADLAMATAVYGYHAKQYFG